MSSNFVMSISLVICSFSVVVFTTSGSGSRTAEEECNRRRATTREDRRNKNAKNVEGNSTGGQFRLGNSFILFDG